MNAKLNRLMDDINPSLQVKSRLLLSELCTEKNVEAGTDFIQEGDLNKSEYFVIDGVVRSHLKSEKGDIVTISFYAENSVLTPNLIRTRDERSTLNYEAITDCTLLELNVSEFGDLIRDYRDVQEFANLILKNELSLKINKEIQLISLTSKARLIQFRKDYRMLENRVPHSMIASYLGITPVSLSRLRNTLTLS